nr:hypothetical protein [Tanacetum cinerariifolium]
VGERIIEGPEMIKVTNEKVVVAKEKLKEARTRQKSYADKHRRSIEFQPGDRVFLKLSHVHNVFHVFLLRWYKYHPLHVISYPLDQIRADLSYVKEPEAILDRQDRVMRNKTIPFIKILWRNHLEREATWETVESIPDDYNARKEGHFAKDWKKAKVKDYNYYKTKMFLAKKDSDEQVLLAEDQAWMKSNESSSSAEETNDEVAYYTSESESESEYETSEYYDNSTNYGVFVNDNDDQEIFHDAIESASENFIENHIDSQKDYDKSEVNHNDSEEKDYLVDKSSSRLARDQSSKQKVENPKLEEHLPPVDTMTDNRTMAEMIRAPTEGLRNEILNFEQKFGESFYEAWDRYKDLLRACPHHGFTELHQLNTFYNALNPIDQDSLNAAAGGNLLERSTQDVLTIIKNKSKVRNSLRKSIASQVKACDTTSSSEIAKLTHAVNEQTSAMTTAMTAMLKQFQATPPPAPVKAVEETCVTCGDAHPYYQCPAAGGNTFPEFKDNIQGYVSVVAGNYNQGSRSLPSNIVANPKGKLKAITTRNGLVTDGPTIPTPPKSITPEVGERVEETYMDPDLAEYTIKVPPPP